MTSLRAIPGALDAAVVAAIDARLDGVERGHRARILLAIESGSRAWGFPSPDSDYDCRFLYVRYTDQYLSPWVKRDVNETPLDPLLDVNGWDLGKALKLVLKGNAVVIEWLQSPIIYRGDPAFHSAMLDFAVTHANRPALARHYLHLGAKQYRTYFADGKAVALKKLFYALRPAMALRWLRLHRHAALPPMHFPTLMAESDLPAGLSATADDLLARKAMTRELGTGPLPPPVRAFIEAEFTAAEGESAGQQGSLSAAAVSAADDLFRSFLDGRGAR